MIFIFLKDIVLKEYKIVSNIEERKIGKVKKIL